MITYKSKKRNLAKERIGEWAGLEARGSCRIEGGMAEKKRTPGVRNPLTLPRPVAWHSGSVTAMHKVGDVGHDLGTLLSQGGEQDLTVTAAGVDFQLARSSGFLQSGVEIKGLIYGH